MTEKVQRAVAVVGVGAVLPDAPDAKTFWENIKSSRYSISEVPDDRWDPNLYYDPDPKAPFKTYSKIGGWARDWTWSPLDWRLPIPPTVSDQMDRTQIWGVVAAREALLDYGYPERPLDPDRTAVILGNAMGGDRHYLTALRIFFPEYGDELMNAPSFVALPEDVRQAIAGELRDGLARRLPDITEDTMSGELANITAGRIANLFNFHGPNFVVDAACASAMAAMDAAIEGLEQGDFDSVLTGGVDGNMSASTFVKFCKIGALSASGTRPYGEGADGFVMGEGVGVFLLKRLEDAEASGDHIYAVIRGLGGSSDGKGKGITAPNPIGQKFAVERAWRNAGRVPDSASLIEGHGTSTRVGDVVEVEAMSEVFSGLGLPPGSLPLGSVKSNIGHLKAAAGAAGMLKAIMALRDKVLPPSLNAERPNPNIDFGDSPLYVNTELQEWKAASDQVRAAAVSAFGFGGTNFHTVIEEYIPGRIRTADHTTTYSLVTPAAPLQAHQSKAPLRGALVVGDVDAAAVSDRLRSIGEEAGKGIAPPIEPPKEADLRAPYRVAIDYGDAAELADRTGKAVKAIEADNEAMWKALRNSGIFHGTGNPGMVAFLYTGQGSQYLNMLETLRETEPIVTEMFAEADRAMEPVLGKPLSDYIYVSSDDPKAIAKADAELRATEITQPAVLAVDEALSRLMDAYGIRPDMVMGHSLGEYGALVAAGALPFEDALEAVAGRGREMSRVSMEDNGLMAAVFAPLEAVERVVESIDGYVVIANINSTKQAVIGGTTPAVEQAMQLLSEGGAQVVPIPVSHAFHTEIVQPASEPLKEILQRLRLESPGIPLVANVDGEFYPVGPNVASRMIDILGRQIASPVQFIKGLRTLYEAGCRVFVEMGPKRALHGFAEDVLGDDPEVVSLYTNHPKLGDVVSFNRGLCGLYAAGLGVGTRPAAAPDEATPAAPVAAPQPTPHVVAAPPVPQAPQAVAPAEPTADTYTELGRLFADFLERGADVYRSVRPAAGVPAPGVSNDRPVVVSGAGLGLPGMERVFDEEGVARILHGDQFIDSIPVRLRQEIVDHHITRLVKSEAGGGRFEEIDSQADVIKLAGRGGRVDLVEEFGYPAERVDALDRASVLAIGAGLAALRDAGIPLVMSYKTTTTGTSLPDRWMLPESMRDDTGIIFASAFPGYDAVMEEQARFQVDVARHQRLEELRALRVRASQAGGSSVLVEDLDHRIHELETELANDAYLFDRKFLFRAVSMGHAQFAEYIGARGPNTQINGACASTTQAVSIAEDWITLGRCRRVIIISADDVTSDNMMQWIGSGFLAVGAAATDEVVEDAAVPFDRRRHGMILGMGAAGIVVEAPDSLRERGTQPIVEVVSSITANSAFHGSRLDPDHIRHVMERLVATAEQRWGIDRHEIATRTAFISHETYTPARGGSAQAEVDALRFVFGASADHIVVTNTKGFTGHAMGAGVEDVVAIKSLETGVVPPVPNYKEPDPDLGHLNLSQGGAYPVSYALRLGAGFGSQISLTLYRHVPSPLGRHPEPDELGFEYRVVDPGAWNRWLQAVTGYDAPQLEFQGRTVRVRDEGPPARVPAAAPAVAPVARVSQPVAAAPAPVAPTSVAVPVVPPRSEAPVGEAPAAVAALDAVPAPAVEEEAPAEPASDVVAARVLEIVAGETGYPPDMLDLDLDLEADLGIDTVKQAEMFAAIRSEFGIGRDDALALRDYPTLQAVIGFVYDNADGLEAPSAVAPAAAAAAPVVAASVVAEEPAVEDPVRERVLEIVAGETGYPPDMLDLDLDLEADLGIDTVKQAEMFAAIRSEFGIGRDDALALRDYPTLQAVIGFVYDNADGLEAPSAVAPAAAAAAPVVAASVVAEEPAVEDPVRERVLEIVAGETGYPPDMLDLDLDLEADLGIDTVKQAEMFAAIRSEFGIGRDDALALRDYPTLQAVIGFVYDNADGLEAPSAVAPAAAAAAPVVAASVVAEEPAVEDPVRERVLEIVAGETGYPPDMLDLDLDLEADLGIDTVKQAEMFAAIRSEFGIGRDDALALRDYPTLQAVIGFVYDNADGLEAPSAVAPAAAAAAPVVAASVVAEEPAVEDPVRERVLEIVAGETGYPPDMLDLDLDLEADLGIDTVKQAEMFAAIRSEFGIGRDDALALRDYPTLQAVIGFVYDNADGLEAPSAAAPAATEEPAVEAGIAPSGLLLGDDEAAARIPRRLPTPVLRPELDRCAPTSVTLGPGSKVLVMLDEGGVGAALVKRLEKDHVDVLTVDDAPSAEDLLGRIDAWAGNDGVQGVYWLPALDVEAPMSEMDLAAWKEALRVRVKLLYATMRHLYEQVAEPGTFLVSATRLGGKHGYDEAGPPAPMGGAVTGFTKAYKRERPDALVKAVDFPMSRKTTAFAKTLVAETLRDPGVVEVGWDDNRRFTIALLEQPLPESASGLELGPDTVFVVTGAAGSIVSAITADLARASGGSFHLLDLVPEPDPDDPDVTLFGANRDALKRVVFERLKASEERATPAMVDRELVGIERAAAALDAIRAVEAAGGTVHYHSVNLLDAAAMASVTGKIAEISGKVDVLLHAGGLEISRSLPDKDPGEYDLVFDVKADGWFNLLSGLADVPIGATVAFSSIAGRFGNAGQTDYSAANDLLCKSGLAFRTTRPETTGIATDWTAWGDIGMATRGSIPTVMSTAGIDMLPAVAGIPIVRRELVGAGGSRELVVGLRLGILQEEWDEAGGLDVAAIELDAEQGLLMVGQVRGFGIHDGLTITTRLDPTEQPFLSDHQREGTPLLPGVMGVESFAAVASLAFPHLHVAAVEDVEFLAPFKFYRNEPRQLAIRARFRADGDEILADCELVGERILANQPEPQVTKHFSGTVRLAPNPPKVRKRAVPEQDGSAPVESADIYRIYFHGPAYQVIERAWRNGDVVTGLFRTDLPDNHMPKDRKTVTEPRLVELCFQTAGVWEIGTAETMGLPMHIDRVVPVKGIENAKGRIFASVRLNESGFAVEVVDESGAVLVIMEGYRTALLPGTIDDDLVAPLRNAMEDR